MRAGKLKDWLTIERVSETRDAMGGAVPTWTTWAAVWGDVRPASGRERFLNSQTIPEANFKCSIRWLDGLTEKDRVVLDGVTYDILYISRDLRNREMTLDLRSGVRND